MAGMNENELKHSLNQLTDLQPDEQSIDRAVGRVRKMLIEKSFSQKTASFHIGRYLMNHRLKRVLAAAIFIILVLGLWQFWPQNGHSTGVIWANVADNLEKIFSYSYRERRQTSTGPTNQGYDFQSDMETRISWSKEIGSRRDVYHGEKLSLSIFSLRQTKECIAVFYDRRKYERQIVDWAGTGGDWDYARNMVNHIKAHDYIELEPDTIEGRVVEGIELTGQRISGERVDDAVTRVWVDANTLLPIRVELIGKVHKTDTHLTIIQDQFKWNPIFEPDWFVPDIPQDFSEIDTHQQPQLQPKQQQKRKPVEATDFT